jgi:hypothetical protein
MGISTAAEAKRATRNLVPLTLWTLGWLLTLALARFGPDSLWHSAPAINWGALILNLALGVGWIVAHVRFLRRVDDLQRKILIDALALALGAGLVGGLAYSVANGVGLVGSSNITLIFCAIMSGAYLLGALIGTLRYR